MVKKSSRKITRKRSSRKVYKKNQEKIRKNCLEI